MLSAHSDTSESSVNNRAVRVASLYLDAVRSYEVGIDDIDADAVVVRNSHIRSTTQEMDRMAMPFGRSVSEGSCRPGSRPLVYKNGTKGEGSLGVNRRPGWHRWPEFRETPGSQSRPITLPAVRVPSSWSWPSTSTRAKVLPEFPPGPALWRSCMGSGRGQNLDDLLDSGLRKV